MNNFRLWFTEFIQNYQKNNLLQWYRERLQYQRTNSPYSSTANFSYTTRRTTPYSGTANFSTTTSFYRATIRTTPYNTTVSFPSATEIKPCGRNQKKQKKNKRDDYFEKQFRQNLTLELKRDLKSKKTEIMEYIKHCFGEIMDNMDFVSWISSKLGYKPNHLKKLLEEKAFNKRRSFHQISY